MATGTSVKVAVVGAGSIGQRHQRLIQELGHEVDVISKSSKSAKYKSLSDALAQENFEYVVLASQTSQHFADLSVLIEKNFVGSVLVEKPIFDRSEKLEPNRFKLLAVGYNLRFHPAIIWLQETLPQLGAISSANLYVGQYLPNWRPDSDYRNSSSAKTESGGGVLRDLSHELDLVQYIFGDWNKLTAIGGKFSDLEIQTDDTFSILMQTDQCSAVSVQMNYSDRLRQRLITVNGNNGTIQIDLVSNSATFNNSQKSFDVQPDSTYVSQHNAVIHNQDLSICSLADALKVVATIEAVEKSAKKSKWITK
jgi:predicted dehydrogenase